MLLFDKPILNLKNILLLIVLWVVFSCRNYIEQDQTNYQYHDINTTDTSVIEPLIAVTNEEFLQYGAKVAYVNIAGDTVIPFGSYSYFGTDTMRYYAQVQMHPNDSTYGRTVGIDRGCRVLFDLVWFENGPDYFHEGLTRVLRNGKMGFANEKGEIVIPCQYAYARWFQNGSAQVTFEAKQYIDVDEHLRVESNSWFVIDKQGNRIIEER